MIHHELRFILLVLKKNIQSSAELRTSFLLNLFGMSINNVSFVLLWVFFSQTVGEINGWTAIDVIGMQGLLAVAYGVVFSFAAGLTSLADYVASGQFDRYLIAPKSLLGRIATAQFNPAGLGDILFGIICLIMYFALAEPAQAALPIAFFAIIFSVILVFSVMLMVQTVSFWFIDSESVVRSIFELFITPSLFHGGAFSGGLRIFYTFVIPSLLVAAVPIEAIRDTDYYKLVLVGGVAGVWLLASWLFFHRAIKRYESSNFMTFG